MMKTTKRKYDISMDTGVEFADAGRWRSFELCAIGDNARDLIESATIAEIDQDGGDLNHYALEDASNEVIEAAMQMIKEITGEPIWLPLKKFGCYYLIEDDRVFIAPMLDDGSMDDDEESCEVTDPAPGFYEAIGFKEKRHCANCGVELDGSVFNHDRHCSTRCLNEDK